MLNYEVTVVFDCPDFSTYIVEAKDELDAETKAIELAKEEFDLIGGSNYEIEEVVVITKNG